MAPTCAVAPRAFCSVAALDSELDRHRAAATVGAARQDDPLAYGTERVRSARAHYADRLDADDQGPRPGVGRGGDGQRREAADAVAELDAALHHTRAARVRALASSGEAPAHLVAVLGVPPADGPGRTAWCGLAFQVQAYRDRHPDRSLDSYNDVVTAIGPRPSPRWHPDPAWDGLSRRWTRFGRARCASRHCNRSGISVPTGECRSACSAGARPRRAGRSFDRYGRPFIDYLRIWV